MESASAGITDAMLAAQIGERSASLALLQYPADLLFRKAATFHALVLDWARTNLDLDYAEGARSDPDLQAEHVRPKTYADCYLEGDVNSPPGYNAHQSVFQNASRDACNPLPFFAIEPNFFGPRCSS